MADPAEQHDPGPSAASPWKRWGPALAVVGALAVAHLGLWLLLTRSARATVAEVEAAWGPGELDAARAPGEAPKTQGEAFMRWQREERLWADVERRQDRRSWVGALGWTMLASCLLQAGFVAWIALKAAPRRERPRAARGTPGG